MLRCGAEPSLLAGFWMSNYVVRRIKNAQPMHVHEGSSAGGCVYERH